MINIEIRAESSFKVPVLSISKKRTFVTVGEYTLSARIKNCSTENFLGGNFLVIIKWPNGLVVNWPFKIGNLASSGMTLQDYGRTHVLDDSPALFYVQGMDVNGQAISFCDMSGNQLKPQPPPFDFAGFTHIYTIIPKNAEELYQLWALVVALISVVPIFIKDIVIPLIQWLVSVIN